MSLRYMLDTDSVSYVLRGVGSMSSVLMQHAPSEVCMSAVTLGELRFGADKRKSKRLHGLIDTFCHSVQALPFGEAEAAVFGRVRASLESRGAPIGVLDTLIAAHAISLGITLVTNNTKHFAKVRGLETENWSAT